MKKVKDFDFYSVTKDGKIYSHISNRFLKQYNHNHGYLSTAFHKDGKCHQRLIHRVVAETYIPNPDNLPTVNHKDGDKRNNHVSNLEWMSYLDNNQHAIDNNMRSDTRIYAEDHVRRVLQLIADGWRYKDIATALGIEVKEVRYIMNADSYSDIKSTVDFSNHLGKGRTMSDSRVILICEMLDKGMRIIDIYREFGGEVPKTNISNIKNRVVHKCLSESYNFWRKRGATAIP